MLQTKKTLATAMDTQDSHVLSESGKRKSSRVKVLFSLFVVLLAIGGLATSAYYYAKYRTLVENPDAEAQKEIESLTKALGEFIDLPTDETPTVATVLDKEKLKDQPFFVKAENGDKLLAYTKAMKAILYRPSTNRIIEVAPIYINQQEGVKQSEPMSSSSVELKIAYYNGTETVGVSGQAEKAVKAVYPQVQTGVIANASRRDYDETLVVDLNGSYGEQAGRIAELLGGKVVSLPDGEARPDADLLVISGK